MAQIDFSNARIEPYGTNTPSANQYASLQISSFYDASGVQKINENDSQTQVTTTKNRVVFRYRGRIQSGFSGTVFLIGSYWKVSNISYSAGDTYDFTVGCDITCN